MKAIIVPEHGILAEVNDYPEPVLNDYTAIVKIETCGFCNGTDTRIICGQMPFDVTYPTALGHEGCGHVVDIGSRVRNIRIGEKHIRIRNTNAPSNPYSSTHGHMSEYGIITDYRAMLEDGIAVRLGAPLIPALIPESMTCADGTMMISLCECLSAVQNFGIDENSHVLVFGAGPMGQMLMRFMIIRGVGSVTCVDCDRTRLQRVASHVGTSVRLINSAEYDIDDVICSQRFDFSVDAVGESDVIYRGASYLKPYGKVCSLGVLRHNDRFIDTNRLPNNTVLHMLNFPFGKYETMEQIFAYIRQGLISPSDYYTDLRPMSQVSDVYRDVLSHATFKTILTVGE